MFIDLSSDSYDYGSKSLIIHPPCCIFILNHNHISLKQKNKNTPSTTTLPFISFLNLPRGSMLSHLCGKFANGMIHITQVDGTMIPHHLDQGMVNKNQNGAMWYLDITGG